MPEVLLDSVAEAGLDKAEAKKATAPWTLSHCYSSTYGSFRKLGVPYFGVLIIRILLFRVLH